MGQSQLSGGSGSSLVAMERVDIIRTDLDRGQNGSLTCDCNVCDRDLLPWDFSFLPKQRAWKSFHFPFLFFLFLWCTSSQQSPELTLKASSAARNTYANGRRVIVWLTDMLSARINPEPLCTPHSIARSGFCSCWSSVTVNVILPRTHTHSQSQSQSLSQSPDPDPGQDQEQDQDPDLQAQAVHLAGLRLKSLLPARDRVIHYQTCAIVCACV